ncbi:MAG: hypothetical protein PHY92_00695 [Alphaproteobacteria bacterium]|nr:hypothetical protein [Alphaproteobacteria bacterium]
MLYSNAGTLRNSGKFSFAKAAVEFALAALMLTVPMAVQSVTAAVTSPGPETRQSETKRMDTTWWKHSPRPLAPGERSGTVYTHTFHEKAFQEKPSFMLPGETKEGRFVQEEMQVRPTSKASSMCGFEPMYGDYCYGYPPYTGYYYPTPFVPYYTSPWAPYYIGRPRLGVVVPIFRHHHRRIGVGIGLR